MRRIVHYPFFAAAFVAAFAGTFATLSASDQPPRARAPEARDGIARAEAALNAGDAQAAESLFAAAASASPRHPREILRARLAASRGDWKNTVTILQNWKIHPERKEGSGEIFFWLAWAALHQGSIPDADSLLVLASAYTDESRAQDALEYRFAALLENSPALGDYLRGLPESPLPEPLRAASLERVPETSRLHPQASWHLAMLLEARGDAAGAKEILTKLSRDPSSPAGRRALTYLAFLLEASSPDSARKGYENLLLKNQQGILPEFARSRLQQTRQNDSTAP